MSARMPPDERRKANQARHWELQKAEAQASRGAKGLASSWWDRARATAARAARAIPRDEDSDRVWRDLARTLEAWCESYDR